MNECTPETGPIKGFKHWTFKKNIDLRQAHVKFDICITNFFMFGLKDWLMKYSCRTLIVMGNTHRELNKINIYILNTLRHQYCESIL